MAERGERTKILGGEDKRWTSLDLQGRQIGQVCKIHPITATPDEHQSSYSSYSRQLEEVRIGLVWNGALDKLDRLQIAKVKSTEVLCQVG